MKIKRQLKLKKITKCMMRSAGVTAAACHLDQASAAHYGGLGVQKVVRHLKQAFMEASGLRLPKFSKAINRGILSITESKAAPEKVVGKLKDIAQKTLLQTFKDCGAIDDLKKIGRRSDPAASKG